MPDVHEIQAHTAPPVSAPPCQCQQEGGAIVWLVVALAIVVGLDRWNARRRKRDEEKRLVAADQTTKEDTR